MNCSVNAEGIEQKQFNKLWCQHIGRCDIIEADLKREDVMVQNQAVDNKIAYTVACVSSFAFVHNISKKEAFSYLYKNKVID